MPSFQRRPPLFYAQIIYPSLSSREHVLFHLFRVSPSTFTSDSRESSRLQFSSAQFSHSVMSSSLRPHGLQHARPPCPSPTLRIYSNSSPSSQWCHKNISSSVFPFSSCLQSFPNQGLFKWVSSSHQSIVVSASAWALPMNIQDWFPLGRTGWISLQSRGLSRVFSNTTVQKHQFFGTQLSL